MQPIYQQLAQAPQQFEFFQAVQLLEQFYQRPVAAADDPVLFQLQPGSGFNATDIVSAQINTVAPATLTVSIMGLSSPQGLLPDPYTEQLLHMLRNKDRALIDFLSLLQQRSLTFYYRAWRKHHSSQQAQLQVMLNGLVGCGLTCQQQQLAIPDTTYLYYAAHFMRKVPTAASLQQMLSDYFAVPVRVLFLQGAWLKVAADQCSRLTQTNATFNQLGVDMMLGNKVWDCQHKFRLVVGPLETSQLQQFLPQGSALPLLKQWVRRYVGPQLQFDIQLSLKAANVPRWQLGFRKDCNLGWTTWLANQPLLTDVNDIILQEKTYEYA